VTVTEAIKERQRHLFLKYAWVYLGTWYQWGGDDPSGFDCSGLVVELLQAVGLIDRKEDYTADGLFRKFSRCCSVLVPYEGCLAFWLKNGVARHVEVCIDSLHTIGASGGGRHVKTLDDAIRHNAFIKIRPISFGARYVDPFLSLCEKKNKDNQQRGGGKT